MNTTLYLIYDGEVFRSAESVELDADTRIHITVESIEPDHFNAAPYAFFHTALSMNL